MQAGDYVRCNFPFREASGPGPSPHIVFCLATGRIRDERFAIVVYTTSRVAFEGRRRPRQHLLVDASQAAALGQATSFHVDVSRVARLPLNSSYFPDMRDGLIPTFGRDASFVKTVVKRQRELIEAGFRIVSVDLASGPHPKP
jgi:hypothetical protein